MSELETNWYEQTWVIVLFLIFFFPVGLFLMWRYADWPNSVKVIVTIVVAGLFLLFVIFMFLFFLGILGFFLAATEDETMQNINDAETENSVNIDETYEGNEESTYNDEDNNYNEEQMELEDNLDVLDAFHIQFDDRDWYVNFEEQQEEGVFVREYLLEGETVDNWNEVITLHFMEGLQNQQLSDFVEQMENEALQNGVDSDALEVNVIEENDDELVYEFIFEDGMVAPSRHEIAKVIRADDGVYILHYANAEVPMPSDMQKEWMTLLKEAKIKG